MSNMYLIILTSSATSILPIEFGVMSTYCRPTERLAALIYSRQLARCSHMAEMGCHAIIFMLTSRFTLSMKTSLTLLVPVRLGKYFTSLLTYNSSRHRIGEPIASQSDKSKQIVEKDFSPPDNVFVWRPFPLLVSSGSTCGNYQH
jgi:hypothetical protein